MCLILIFNFYFYLFYVWVFCCFRLRLLRLRWRHAGRCFSSVFRCGCADDVILQQLLHHLIPSLRMSGFLLLLWPMLIVALPQMQLLILRVPRIRNEPLIPAVLAFLPARPLPRLQVGRRM